MFREDVDIVTTVEGFTLENDIAAYFIGICQDFKHFGLVEAEFIKFADCGEYIAGINLYERD